MTIEEVFNCGVPCRTTLAIEPEMEWSAARRAFTLAELKSLFKQVSGATPETTRETRVLPGTKL